MHSLPQLELPDQQEQEEYSEAFGTQEVLQILQEDAAPQGNQVKIKKKRHEPLLLTKKHNNSTIVI